MADLPELAALAAEKVPGFVPRTEPCSCVYGGGCASCQGEGRVIVAEPAAPLMAVAEWSLGDARREVVTTRGMVSVVAAYEARTHYATVPDDKPETVARALLVSLLAAHGVEVGHG